MPDPRPHPTAATTSTGSATAPARAGLVLLTLILAAAVANLNLSVANVALPSIRESFDSSQVQLNLVGAGYSLGLAATVLHLGAAGDRYGRKLMLLLGTALAIPMSVLAALAPSDEVLFAARVGGGFAAGMAFPTTLAIITALWSGPPRTRAIALWSATGGGLAALGPLLSGAILEWLTWEWVFLVTLPLVAVALVLAFLPGRARGDRPRRDNRVLRQAAARREPSLRPRRRPAGASSGSPPVRE